MKTVAVVPPACFACPHTQAAAMGGMLQLHPSDLAAMLSSLPCPLHAACACGLWGCCASEGVHHQQSTTQPVLCEEGCPWVEGQHSGAAHTAKAAGNKKCVGTGFDTIGQVAA
jgi:hypothetical protein